MSGEASYLLTGFGTYQKALLSRLHDTGKYEIAELATYGTIEDPKSKDIPWKYYANAVDPTDPRHEELMSHSLNQFGQWRFDRVLLDFKSDIVIDIRDPWMLSYEQRSVFRDFFHHIIMPTVDSSPQQDEWLELFMDADAVFTYSDWNKKVLEREGHGRIKLKGVASPGVDLDLFKPVADKKQSKIDLGLDPDTNIIGTVMRNQQRKLFPDLLHAFRKFLDMCVEKGKKDIADKTYLYIHTSYPDIGWNFSELLKETGLGHKIFFTYICKMCKRSFCSFFQDARTVCPHCNSVAGVLPSTNEGLELEQMPPMYNLFDVYVQYSICEGFGLGQSEAASCSVPIMSVDYSAMEDVVRNVKGFPLKVKKMFRECDTHSYRAMPDNDFLANSLYTYFTQNDEYRARKGKQARQGAEKYYDWDKTAKVWERYIDSVDLETIPCKWDSTPMRQFSLPAAIPENLTNEQFVEWLMTEVYHRPHKINSYHAMRLLRDLNYGATKNGKKWEPISREKLFDMAAKTMRGHNEADQGRCGVRQLIGGDYLDYANRKEQ